MQRLWLASLILAGCVGPGKLTDGTSVSFGLHADGALRNGVLLPPRGEGYVVPPRWLLRDRSYGTEELVQLLVDTARRVSQKHPRAVLGVGDLSLRGGGGTKEHLSHHSGRDVDLILYAVSPDNTPLHPTEMIAFDQRGAFGPQEPLPLPVHSEDLTAPPPPQAGFIDLPATWTMVEALVTHPRVAVQWIFIGRPLAALLLRYARRIRAPEHVLARAAAVFHQPSNAGDHMDHIHVRIYCPFSDRYQGCRDGGPGRWMVKELKYVDIPLPVTPLPAALDQARLPLRALPLGSL